MRNFNFLCVLIIVVLNLLACGESTKERQQRETIDSLQNENYQGRMNYEDLQQYLAIIASGLDSISMEENELLMKNTPGENMGYNKQRMKQQLSHVREILARHRDRIDELEKKLASGTGDAKRLHTIITALKQQLEQKDKELAQLRVELDDSKKSISELRNTVTKMQNVQDEQQNTIAEQESKIQKQEEKINNAYVLIASKKQLKSKGLLSGGFLKKKKVDYSNIDLSAFQKIDIRKTLTIPVPQKYKILTPVPAGSYSVSGGTLKILNPEKFWSASNFLIIQID